MTRFALTRYGETYYNTIKYGESSWYSGEWLSPPVYAGGSILSDTTFSWSGLFDNIVIEYGDEELVLQGSWLYEDGIFYTTEPGSTGQIALIGKEITINYDASPDSTIATYEIFDKDGIIIDDGSIDMYSAQSEQKSETIAFSDFDIYTFVITHGGGEGGIYLRPFEVLCTDTYIFTRHEGGSWVKLVPTHTGGNNYTSATSALIGQDDFQIKIELLSGAKENDIMKSSQVDNLSVNVGNMDYYSKEGQWVKELDLGSSVQSLEDIDWIPGQQPEDTKVTVQTKTSLDGETWTDWSNPYTEEPYQVQLKQGEDEGTIITEPIEPNWDPVESKDFCSNWHYQLVQGSYYIPQGTTIERKILNADGEEIQLKYSQSSIEQTSKKIEELSAPGAEYDAKYDLNKDGLINSSDLFLFLGNVEKYAEQLGVVLASNILTQPIRIKTVLKRDPNGNSPVLFSDSLRALITYNEDKVMDQDERAKASNIFGNAENGFNQTSGYDIIRSIEELNFSIPSEQEPSFEIISNTFDNDIQIYWKSEEDNLSKSTLTNIQDDEVWFSCDKVKHYQYMRGIVYHGDDLLIDMSGVFSPYIPSSNIEYGYRIMNGWNENTINSNVELYWESDYPADPNDDRALVTTISTSNGYSQNDKVIVISNTESHDEDTPWPSDVRKYSDTSIIVNANYTDKMEDYSNSIILPSVPPYVSNISYHINIVPNSIKTNGIDLSYSQSKDNNTITIYDEDGDERLEVSLEINESYDAGIVSAYSDYKHFRTVGSYWLSENTLKNPGYDGEGSPSCSVGNDFISGPLPSKQSIVWGTIPQTVDTSTLRYKIHHNNFLVHTYGKYEGKTVNDIATDILKCAMGSGSCLPEYDLNQDGIVDVSDAILLLKNPQEYQDRFDFAEIIIGTLGNRRPSRYWNPYIRDGHYYLSKDEYYLYSSPQNLIESTTDKMLEIPYQPKKQAPIIIKDSNGTILRQVAFSRPEDNKYVTYLTETVTLDGLSEVKLSYTIDPNYNITIAFDDGNLNYLIDDNRLILAVYNNDPEPSLIEMPYSQSINYKGMDVQVTYQPKDCFVIEYNTSSQGSVKMTFSQDYQDLDITFESADDINEYFTREVEFNPLRTSKTSGFLYIAKADNPVRHIEIISSPNILIADGHSRSLIIAESKDKDGNPTSYTDMSATASKGQIVKYIHEEGVELLPPPNIKDMSGRDVFIYTAPLITGSGQEKDKIVISDEDGVSREHTITLIRRDIDGD